MTDIDGHSVRVFAESGALLAELGSNKNDDFELDNPSGIAVSFSAPNFQQTAIYVINTGENQIKKFGLA
ncbi:MAG: hypothetical protein ACRDJC_09460 [Thermomicrobiales bacterium]